MHQDKFLKEKTLLNKKTTYPTAYDKQLLCPIPREKGREMLSISSPLPFHGMDIWNAYELSWLNAKGKPVVAAATLTVPCDSPCLVESKSLKLYLNSFNQTTFQSFSTVHHTLSKDLSDAIGSPISITLTPLAEIKTILFSHFDGICLDYLDIHCDQYTPDAACLSTEKASTTETVYSDLFKSNCPVTGQPDWASIKIKYTGHRIEHHSLLSYLVSFRNHAAFHEQCVEKIFVDIMAQCAPEKLAVYARFTRRGGLDINPFRSNDNSHPENLRLSRQ